MDISLKKAKILNLAYLLLLTPTPWGQNNLDSERILGSALALYTAMVVHQLVS
jgi:hypothetical protein